MKKGVILTISVLLALYLLFSTARFTKIAVEASNGYPVHNLDTGLNYTSIQGAINANETLSGHTIYVEEGVYFEHVVMNKSLYLIGESQESTIIDGENIGDHEAGVVLFIHADNILLNNFTILGSGCCGACGVYVKDCYDVTISRNTVVRNNGFGIKLDNATKVSLSHNNVSDNLSYGVQLINSSDNRILGNIVKDQTTVAISLRDSRNNTIAENDISNSTVGITFEASDNNLVFHNRFFDNNFHVQSVSSTNTFDNGFEGNYWSDYKGSDLNHDGLGDSEYEIDLNYEDRFPLMGRFSNFNATSEHRVQTICNSTISGFQHNGTSISFNVTGENGSAGFCRICIPTALMSDYQIFVNGTEVDYNLLPVSNSTHSYLYFTYNHSTKEVVIIPELPSLILLPLFMLCTLLATIFYRRKNKVCTLS